MIGDVISGFIVHILQSNPDVEICSCSNYDYVTRKFHAQYELRNALQAQTARLRPIHWRQSRKDVWQSVDKNYPLSTKSTELNMFNFGDNVDCRPRHGRTSRRQSTFDKSPICRRFWRLSTLSPVHVYRALQCQLSILVTIITLTRNPVVAERPRDAARHWIYR